MKKKRTRLLSASERCACYCLHLTVLFLLSSSLQHEIRRHLLVCTYSYMFPEKERRRKQRGKKRRNPIHEVYYYCACHPYSFLLPAYRRSTLSTIIIVVLLIHYWYQDYNIMVINVRLLLLILLFSSILLLLRFPSDNVRHELQR